MRSTARKALNVPDPSKISGFSRRQEAHPASSVARPLEQGAPIAGRRASNRFCSESINQNNQIAICELLG
jgi:hypothetical protein